jgi:hypothetical protein
MELIGTSSKMIIYMERFNQTSRGSAIKILCECDNCHKRAFAVKQNIMRMGTYTLCQPCAVAKISRERGREWVTPEFRIAVSLGHRNRDKSTYPLRGFSGEKNGRWNPDRDLVQKREKARKAMYSMLQRCLKLSHTEKSAATYASLGYSPDDLYNHLDAKFLPGMSWNSRGAWHIDHIKTVAEFISEGITDPKIINALENLRPLWKQDNLSRLRRVVIE